jgi:hypothetical protein
MPRVTSRSWTDEHVELLRSLVKKGASVARASVALKRTKASVRNKAREIGLPFATQKELRKKEKDNVAEAGFPPSAAAGTTPGQI